MDRMDRVARFALLAISLGAFFLVLRHSAQGQLIVGAIAYGAGKVLEAMANLAITLGLLALAIEGAVRLYANARAGLRALRMYVLTGVRALRARTR